MKPKFLLFTAWVFYLIAQRTGDDLWLYCMIYSIALAACAFLYQRDNKKSAHGSNNKAEAAET